jgi:predicted MFS family arabinose efflux permease
MHSRSNESYWYLAIIVLIYMVTFSGRQILAVSIEPIKLEFQVSDTLIGVVTGPAFAFIFALCGLPMGRLSDRINRSRMIIFILGIWTFLSTLGALAGSFGLLILSRMGIAGVEAGITPTSMSLISDIFPPEKRSFAISLYTAAPTISAVFGLGLGGWLVSTQGWRFTFLALSGCGLLLTIASIIWLKEPHHIKDRIKNVDNISFIKSLKMAWKIPSFQWIAIAAGLTSLAGYSFGMWSSVFLVRSHGLSIAQSGVIGGLLFGLTAAAGTLTGGSLCDRLIRKNQEWQIGVPIIGLAISTVVGIIYFQFPIDIYFTIGDNKIPYAVFFGMLYSFFNVWWAAPIFAAATHLSPNNMRSFTLAILSLCTILLGVGAGPLFVGLVSDLLEPTFKNHSLRHAMTIILLTQILGMIFFFKSKKLYSNYINQQKLSE